MDVSKIFKPMKEIIYAPRVVVLTALLSSAAQADDGGMVGLAKALSPFEGLLFKGAIGLVLFLVALVGWEYWDHKRASRSSLDIAKLAAAAAKKKTSAGAPASGSLPSVDTPSTGRSFAPPPPPPPPPATGSSQDSGKQSAPPPPPAGGESSPFGKPGEAASGAAEANPAESTVAFTPPDSSSSGGWADLLQRVRAGEPEAASFGEMSPPPSTEQEGASPFSAPPVSPQNQSAPPPPADAGSSGGFSAPPTPPAQPQAGAGESSSSSEAWEALLKRTTGGSSGDSGMNQPPSKDSGRISLGSSFGDSGAPNFGGEGQGGQPPQPPQQPGQGSSGGFALPNLSNQDAPPPPDSPGSSGGFSIPGGGGAPGAGDSGGFQLPGSQNPPPQQPGQGSSFSLPGAAASQGKPDSPSFKLPGSEGAPGGGNPPSPGFQLPGQGSQNPFDSGAQKKIEDPSNTLPLSDMFSGSGGGGSPPSFQLPSLGSQQGGKNPFEMPGGGQGQGNDPSAGRTISLDFSQSGGQIPPPPGPKTEG